MFEHKWFSSLLLILFFMLNTSVMAIERMVAIDNPYAQDTGTGLVSAPYKTLSYAMSQLKPGDHLTVMAGTYRDALVFPEKVWTRIDEKLIDSGKINNTDLVKANQTIIEGKGEVLIKGSDLITNWRHLGNGRFVKTWLEEPQQVFINEKPLNQIGGTIFGGFPEKPNHPLATLHKTQKGIWPGRRAGDQNLMPENSFYYHSSRNLPSLNGHTVEVSVRPTLLGGKGVTDITIKNLRFQHANTSTTRRGGLISMSGIRITINNLHVNQADSVGFALIGNDISLLNSSANQCGQLGILARGMRMQLKNNQTNDNNTRGFNKWWEAGGAKFVGNGGLQDSIVSNHQALRNFGDGIWFDWKNRNNTVQNSFSAYNTGFGIHYEASDQGHIINNIVLANQQRGIYLIHSSKSLVAFNLVASSQMQGIAIVDENRRDTTSEFDFGANGNQVFGNVIAWNVGSLVLPTKIADNTSDYNVFIGDDDHTRSGLGWVNMFMATLGEWSTRTQQDKHSLHIKIPIGIAYKESITHKNIPNLDWYALLRDDFKHLTLSPELEKLIIDTRDLRPGANFSPKLALSPYPSLALESSPTAF